MKPGLSRAIIFGILGFLGGGLLVFLLRLAQDLDPIWDPSVGLVVMAFTTAFAMIWGIGAFDPRMNVHGDHHDEEEEADSLMDMVGGFTWKLAALVLLFVAFPFIFALLPTGLRLDIAGEASASFSQVGMETVTLPFGGPEIELSQLTILAGFIIFTFVSLAVFGGGIAFLFYILSGHVKEAKESETEEQDLIPPYPVRLMGRLFGWLANVLRGIPSFLGQKS